MITVKIGLIAPTIRYQAFDGKMFKTEIWCKAYERELIEKRKSAKK